MTNRLRYLVFFEGELAEDHPEYPAKKGIEGQSVIYTDKEPETQEEFDEINKFLFSKGQYKRLDIRRIAEWPEESPSGDVLQGEIVD